MLNTNYGGLMLMYLAHPVFVERSRNNEFEIRLRMVESYAMGIETLAKNWWPARTLIRLSNVYLTPKIYNFAVVGVESCCTELFLTWQLAMLAPSQEIVQYNIPFCTNWILSKGHFFGCSPIHTNLFA